MRSVLFIEYATIPFGIGIAIRFTGGMMDKGSAVLSNSSRVGVACMPAP
jgi:threonine/homoserine efflux transporter RhtA